MDEKFKSSIFLNRYSSDGYDLNNNDELKTVNEFKNFTSQLKLGYTFNDKFNIALNFRNYTQTIDNIASSTLSGESFTSEDNLNLILSYKSNKIKTDLEVYFTSYFGDEFLDDEDGNIFSESFYDQILLKPEIRSVYNINSKKIIF